LTYINFVYANASAFVRRPCSNKIHKMVAYYPSWALPIHMSTQKEGGKTHP